MPDIPLRPVAVQPLEYEPPRPSRPGLLTAVGVLSIVFGSLAVLTNGSSLLQTIMFYWLSRSVPAAPSAVTVSTSGPGGTVTTTMPAPPFFTTMGLGPTLTHATGAIVNLALAIFLIVAGAMLLRNSRRGRSLHLLYAVVKIPAAILAGIAYGWWYSSFIGGVATAGGGTAPSVVFWMMGAFWTLIGCLYPIALLIVLNTRGIRQFCAGLNAS